MPAPLSFLVGLTEGTGQRDPTTIREAAEEFEALLLAQLMATMRKTIPQGITGQGYDAQLWTSMMDQALTKNMAQGGGIGLADVLMQQLDPDAGTTASPTSLFQHQRAQRAYGVASADGSPGRIATGALQRVQLAAAEMLQPDQSHRWSQQGELTPAQLSNDFTTGAEGVEGFNVLDAQGFRGSYKCNLFAFELAFRSGLRVPVMGRGRGWGYFAPDAVVRQIDEGRLDPRWARPADQLSEKGFAWAREQGLPLMVVGAGQDGHAGQLGAHQDVVARMYRCLQQGCELTSDPRIRMRLDDLVLYTRYLELYGEYRNADGKARQLGFEQVWRHAYRMRDRMMLSTVALCDRDRFRDRSVQVPDDVELLEEQRTF